MGMIRTDSSVTGRVVSLVVLGSVALGLAGVAWALVRFWRLAAIGSAYKAKILCTAVFGAGHDLDPRRAPEVSSDSYWILRFFRAHIDRDRRSVTVSLAGLRPRLAVYRNGLGSTLVESTHGSTASPAPLPPVAIAHSHRWTVAATPWPLGKAVELAFTEPSPKRLRRTRAVVVAQHGRLIAERYAPGFDRDSPFAGWSLSKSVMSALIGILIGEGRMSLQDAALWPEWRSPDPRASISIEDLLRMRSGLQFSEEYSDLSSDVIEMLFSTPDVVSYAVNRPLTDPPGTVWSYTSGTTNILSGILRRTVGDERYHAWPRHRLFDPIGMESAVMEVDAAGNFVSSSFMLATARDWARFGQLFLQDGIWVGRQLLPARWARFCVTPTPQSPEGKYGAHWWLKLQPDIGGTTPAAARIPPDAFFAVGHEGQTLTVIPSRGLVVVRLGLSIYIDAWNHAQFIAEIVDAVPV